MYEIYAITKREVQRAYVKFNASNLFFIGYFCDVVVAVAAAVAG